MDKLPKITIVTPSYNQASYLASTIESVLDQNYPNLEYIVIDGGSTDDSTKILEKYDRHLSFWESVPDRGQSHAINKGFARSSGDIMGWINSDDMLESGALHEICREFNQTQDAAWLIGGTRVTDQKGKTLDTRLAQPITLRTFYTWPVNWFPQQSTYWNRAMWDLVGPIREDLHYIMDYDLWNRMYAIANPKLTETVLAAYRMHEDAKCVIQRDSAISEFDDYTRREIERACQTEDPAVLAKIKKELANELVLMQQELWKAEARIERIRRHLFFGPLLRLWRLLINRNFDV